MPDACLVHPCRFTICLCARRAHARLQDADIVVVEYGLNDVFTNSDTLFNNPVGLRSSGCPRGCRMTQRACPPGSMKGIACPIDAGCDTGRALLLPVPLVAGAPPL